MKMIFLDLCPLLNHTVHWPVLEISTSVRSTWIETIYNGYKKNQGQGKKASSKSNI